MTTNIISRAEFGDIPDIKRIEEECGLSPWSVGAYEMELKLPGSLILKAQAGEGTIAGFVVGRARDGGEAEILNIGTALRFQRRGIGSKLIEEFRAICAERRVSVIWLEVRSTNHSAIDFYKSHGFIKKGVRPKFYSNPTEDADLMALALT